MRSLKDICANNCEGGEAVLFVVIIAIWKESAKADVEVIKGTMSVKNMSRTI